MSTKDLIKENATILFGEYGYKGTAINDIVNAVGIKKGSFEAARAGEAGKGFAVVADEIRKLAEQSKISSENINLVIRQISTEADNMVMTSKGVGKGMTEQLKTIGTAIESFKKIIKSIKEVNPQISGINQSMNSIKDEKNTIVEKLESAFAISEEVSASAEEIAASAEEMTASSEEVAGTAQDLSNMTREIVDALEKFIL